ncbi:MAG TPA: glutamate 5-kinase [Beutenbergiaceae bacterium]|nr:glutamate 5-kinase [Beutenbergiaceae bacterium]
MTVTTAVTSRAALADPNRARRVVVKIGSSSLTDPGGRLDVRKLNALVEVLAARRASGGQVVLVSSGAIASALGVLGLTARPQDLATAQAAASVGQGLLMAHYTRAFGAHDITVGQVLLTVEDVVRRAHHRNVQRNLERLLALGVLPIVNENDAVATQEIKFGDNDRLAALVSHLSKADALVLLTDVDALYDRSPRHPDAQRIARVDNQQDLAGIEVTARGGGVGTGGMVSKLESAAIASGAGIPVVVTSAENAGAVLSGADVGTWFEPAARRVNARRLWLAHAAHTGGSVQVDDGAVRAITVGKKSLLAAGVISVAGEFDAGEPIDVLDPVGRVVARGLAAYSAEELPERLGRTSAELRQQFGPDSARAVVHRDDLVVLDHRA